MTGREEFRSFKDLRRAKEPDPPAAPAAATDRGWTVEDERGVAPDLDLEALPDPDQDARGRITARPDGYGPMDSGPPSYRDEDSDEMQLLRSFHVRTIFPGDVLAEVAGLPEDPSLAEAGDRLDLRDRPIFTIDGPDAKDFDDAIGIVELPGGGFEVGVHIADVAHYVREGTVLDAEALARGTSVYLADQVVPMLPEKLSNHLCSLVPGRDRLAFSVIMEFDARGTRTAARMAKSIIRSVQRNTYGAVQELLDGKSTPEAERIRFLEQPLRAFQRWTKKQQELRDAKGSMRIQSSEKKFVFDERHEVARIVEDPRYFSHSLIEETALAANQAVGDLFRERGLPTIYRVHPEKDPEEVAEVAKMLAEHGIRVPEKERLTGRDVGRMIRAARKQPNAEALIQRIMSLVERAVYEVKDDEDVAKHWGLAREAYLHFTSPIRRYPDLIVHRWLWAIQSRPEEAERELRSGVFIEDLNAVAAHCSVQSEVAEMAETAVGDLKICQYLEPHIGEKVDARVLRVSRAGMEILLLAFNVTGFLPVRDLGERAVMKGPTLTVRSGKRSLSFTEGYPIAVRIKDVDFLRLQVMLQLA